MILIVGLGNPGEKYQNNRHNVGFMFVDYLIDQYQILNIKNQKYIANIKYNKYLQSEILKNTIDNKEIILVKPQTFMNNSGIVVNKIIRNLKLEIRNLVVVHDDLDIPLGKFKFQKGTGPRLHNGINSIEKALGTADFCRIRVGVDNRPADSKISGEAYVLQNFTPEEKKVVNDIFPQIRDRLTTTLPTS